jgi:hypothetical protein
LTIIPIQPLVGDTTKLLGFEKGFLSCQGTLLVVGKELILREQSSNLAESQ